MLRVKQKVFGIGEINKEGNMYTQECAEDFVKNFNPLDKLGVAPGLQTEGAYSEGDIKVYIEGKDVMMEVNVVEGTKTGQRIKSLMNKNGAISMGSRMV